MSILKKYENKQLSLQAYSINSIQITETSRKHVFLILKRIIRTNVLCKVDIHPSNSD